MNVECKYSVNVNNKRVYSGMGVGCLVCSLESVSATSKGGDGVPGALVHGKGGTDRSKRLVGQLDYVVLSPSIDPIVRMINCLYNKPG